MTLDIRTHEGRTQWGDVFAEVGEYFVTVAVAFFGLVAVIGSAYVLFSALLWWIGGAG